MADSHLVMCGSPADGICRRAAQTALHLLAEQHPTDEVKLIDVAALNMSWCVGCNRCKDLGRCFMRDDMDEVIATLSRASSLSVVAPVYFAGPSAPYKALLDRLQPLFWNRMHNAGKTDVRRSARLLVVGQGGDPHGFDPLVVCTRSALAVAGFLLDVVEACIGQDAEEILRRVPAWIGCSHDKIADEVQGGFSYGC
ncbi:flavodoxin family protein [Cryptobacterium curtum]|nr:NAD(P)H-dependent oxidoreductase [Cryptobacterium curtum]